MSECRITRSFSNPGKPKTKPIIRSPSKAPISTPPTSRIGIIARAGNTSRSSMPQTSFWSSSTVRISEISSMPRMLSDSKLGVVMFGPGSPGRQRIVVRANRRGILQHQSANQFDQPVHVDWFGDVCVKARLLCSQSKVRLLVTGNRNYGNLVHMIIPSNLPGRFQPVDARQREVHQNNVRALAQ